MQRSSHILTGVGPLTATLLTAVIVMTGLSVACYHHRGHRTDTSAPTLMNLVEEACHRNDVRASRMLLERLVAHHPAHALADRAERRLNSPSPCSSPSALQIAR